MNSQNKGNYLENRLNSSRNFLAGLFSGVIKPAFDFVKEVNYKEKGKDFPEKERTSLNVASFFFKILGTIFNLADYARDDYQQRVSGSIKKVLIPVLGTTFSFLTLVGGLAKIQAFAVLPIVNLSVDLVASGYDLVASIISYVKFKKKNHKFAQDEAFNIAAAIGSLIRAAALLALVVTLGATPVGQIVLLTYGVLGFLHKTIPMIGGLYNSLSTVTDKLKKLYKQENNRYIKPLLAVAVVSMTVVKSAILPFKIISDFYNNPIDSAVKGYKKLVHNDFVQKYIPKPVVPVVKVAVSLVVAVPLIITAPLKIINTAIFEPKKSVQGAWKGIKSLYNKITGKKPKLKQDRESEISSDKKKNELKDKLTAYIKDKTGNSKKMLLAERIFEIYSSINSDILFKLYSIKYGNEEDRKNLTRSFFGKSILNDLYEEVYQSALKHASLDSILALLDGGIQAHGAGKGAMLLLEQGKQQALIDVKDKLNEISLSSDAEKSKKLASYKELVSSIDSSISSFSVSFSSRHHTSGTLKILSDVRDFCNREIERLNISEAEEVPHKKLAG